ncbi:hypothetical protein BI347_17585 [Chromobacterium sphagni]|uniref:Haemolysin-type calcium binding-related domain-containing protein n=1 Tax=Chromobacterium sphagni TaxID=1903179 RepID=A0A1S1WVZ6_9NEIS|nr:hypothetical protein [Chromobacterium sphagni]OHX11480.1 hypothetical protein BI347_17585 [Chromobacterium sphagni]
MRIASVTEKLSSSFSQTQSLDLKQSISVRQPPLIQTVPDDNVQLSSEGLQSLLSSGMGMDDDALYSLLKAVLEKAFGIHIRLWDGQQPGSAIVPETSPPQVDTQQSMDYQQTQQLGFAASGQITTQDGRQFQFSLNVSMQSHYQYHSDSSSQSGGHPTDPLMVSLGGDAGSFSGATVSFDLQNNGQMINLPFSSDGGWLVLDKNGNGQIDNGSELFGPQSGDGFADLAKLDSNHDGVIDESDPAYAQLKIWTGRVDGKEQLETLQQAHIGAILLPSVSTPLTIRSSDASATPQAQMERSGVFLQDDGQAGMISQVDVYS